MLKNGGNWLNLRHYHQNYVLKKEYSAGSRDCFFKPTLNYQILRNSGGCVRRFDCQERQWKVHFLLGGYLESE
jgi:hypothetical protein